MGIALWAASGAVAFAAARPIAAGRPQGYAAEAIVAVAAGLVAGVAATALDFGGWNELDWRAAAFAILCAFAAVACLRIFRLTRRSLA